MKNSLDLINTLSEELKCEYLSDLHAPVLLTEIKRAVSQYNAEDFTLDEWQDMINYVIQKQQCFSTCEEAKKFILEY